ncbi:MAG: restriction endonuclease, SacI family [Tepidisphaeraceae bacterium]
MPALDPELAKADLSQAFDRAQDLFATGHEPTVDKTFKAACDAVFRSKTSSYREVLPGFCLARLQDTSIDLRLPYAKQGANAFNARSLDTGVVNPILHRHRLPTGKSPYLAVFRRQFKFTPDNRVQMKDQERYDELLRCIDFLQAADHDTTRQALVYVLFCFVRLREESNLPVSQLRRISVRQCRELFDFLVATKSGGRLPVLLVKAALTTLNEHFALGWEFDVQEINVSDHSSGAAGDVTVTKDGRTVLAAEITERVVDRNRVVTTFNTKISPSTVTDYVFFVTDAGSQPKESMWQAHVYFAQGHEISFVEIQNWIQQTLVTLGQEGRDRFNQTLVRLIADSKTPKLVKAAWNEAVDGLTATE